jgi:hypothetical protein
LDAAQAETLLKARRPQRVLTFALRLSELKLSSRSEHHHHRPTFGKEASRSWLIDVSVLTHYLCDPPPTKHHG